MEKQYRKNGYTYKARILVYREMEEYIIGKCKNKSMFSEPVSIGEGWPPAVYDETAGRTYGDSHKNNPQEAY